MASNPDLQIRVRTGAQCTVLDDGAQVWRAVVRLTARGRDDEYISALAYDTEAEAIGAARLQGEQAIKNAQAMGCAVTCGTCGHPPHIEACACGCAARRKL